MPDVVALRPKHSAKSVLSDAIATPNVTKCIVIVDGEDMDTPLYWQHGMDFGELAYYGALLQRRAVE